MGKGAWRLEGSDPSPLRARPCAQVANGPEENCHSELYTFHTSPGVPEDAQPAASQAERARSPSALAPGKWPPRVPGPELGDRSVGVLHGGGGRKRTSSPRLPAPPPVPKHTPPSTDLTQAQGGAATRPRSHSEPELQPRPESVSQLVIPRL